MKLLIVLEVDVSSTLANTMERGGFTLAPDGTGMQIKVPNSPTVPRRKIKTTFIRNPSAEELKMTEKPAE